jgi:hypothetical protein
MPPVPWPPRTMRMTNGSSPSQPSATRWPMRSATRQTGSSSWPWPARPGRKLVEVAHTVHADLLVLAGHGPASVLPGSAGQYVLRKAPCPVLVVPDADRRG